MKTLDEMVRPGLAQGQLWKLDDAYIQIVDLGKRLIHYKHLRQPQQKAALTRMIGIEALANYLKAEQATLVEHGTCSALH